MITKDWPEYKRFWVALVAFALLLAWLWRYNQDHDGCPIVNGKTTHLVGAHGKIGYLGNPNIPELDESMREYIRTDLEHKSDQFTKIVLTLVAILVCVIWNRQREIERLRWQIEARRRQETYTQDYIHPHDREQTPDHSGALARSQAIARYNEERNQR